ncbi:MAG: serpin family protein [Clostridia bacterium]|nr:serpin family protein [Clostridia bacterium]
MNRKVLSFAALACAAVCAASMAACGDGGKSKQLGKPVEFEDGQIENLAAFQWKADAFAASFAAETYAAYHETDNFTVSPISVYSALALAAECAAGETRTEILSALGVTYEQLRANYSALYDSLNKTYETEGKVISTLSLGNSVWLDERLDHKQSCIEALSSYYQSDTYSADFYNDNEAANQAVRKFVKEQTNGLIDKDFQLSKETLFTLINTLYLKTVWNTNGTDLKFTADKYDFKNSDGTSSSVNLLQGKYCSGRVYKGKNFSSFYISAEGGYKIKFILPKDGKTLAEVFTAENIAEANAVIDYLYYNEKKNVAYETRCFFPEFKCKYDDDIQDVLKDKFGIKLLFDDVRCDFSAMTDTTASCEKVQHVTDLTVDKTGIEGAAVTLMENVGTTCPPPTIYADFVLDRAFGFVITNKDNVTLFSGVVNKV